jgi:hypothetical protein
MDGWSWTLVLEIAAGTAIALVALVIVRALLQRL